MFFSRNKESLTAYCGELVEDGTTKWVIFIDEKEAKKISFLNKRKLIKAADESSIGAEGFDISYFEYVKYLGAKTFLEEVFLVNFVSPGHQ